MIHDLREWLNCVEQLGELVCVAEPVDPIEEMGAVTYLVAKQTPSPAVLFERPRGFESSPFGARLLWNILGPSIRRFARTLSTWAFAASVSPTDGRNMSESDSPFGLTVIIEEVRSLSRLCACPQWRGRARRRGSRRS